MSEKKARLYTVLIKVAIAFIATAFLVIFLFQYTNMIKLQNQVDKNNSTLSTLTEQNDNLQQQIANIQNPENEDEPNQEYVVDTAHENGYVADGEKLINEN